MNDIFRLGIVGGGPSALFLYRALLQSTKTNLRIDIFEKSSELGAGMPYSSQGAGEEHVTNISGNEIPPLVDSVVDWIKTLPDELLCRFKLERDSLTDYKVLPRTLFGQYLSAQFELLLSQGREKGMETNVQLNAAVEDIRAHPDINQVRVVLDSGVTVDFDAVVICTGHVWPQRNEHSIPNYFDSPYPPRKLHGRRNHPVAIRGTSLTAIDAIRTLARLHGEFIDVGKRVPHYRVNEDSSDFRIVMHSREGFLPGIRFHLDDPRLQKT